MYETLLKLNKLQVVFDMNPKYLENYLREQEPQNPEHWKKKQQKLLTFYDATRNGDSKVRFLATMAFEKMPHYSLEERHNFLVAANFAWKQIQGASTSLQPSAVSDYANLIQQALQVKLI